MKDCESKEIGVYQIKINDKIYVGSTTQSFYRRWKCHLYDLRRNIHGNSYLQKAYNKYGEDTLEFSILEIVIDKKNCIPYEQKWLDKLKPEFNICQTAGNTLGRRHTTEARKKIGEATRTGNRGQNISQALTGRKLSEANKKAIGESLKGRKHSEETKRKISESNKGKHYERHLSMEQRKKMSEASKGSKNGFYGKHHTEETKQKIRQSNKNRRISDETRLKLSMASKGRNTKSVICINTGEIFSSLSEACNYYNINISDISMCCSDKYDKTSAGIHPTTKEKLVWKFYNKN